MNGRSGTVREGCESASDMVDGQPAAALGLGSNLGDRRHHLARALRALQREWRLTAVSSLYETAPVGDDPKRGPEAPFLNLCAVLAAPPGPRRLLDELRELEARAGRPASPAHRRGDRTLDLDLLLYGDRRIREEGLVVPHPRMEERAFVMIPLAEIAGAWRVPGTGRTVADLARGMNPEGVERLGPAAGLLEMAERRRP